MATTANDAPLGITLICVLAALGTILGLFGGLGTMGLAGSSGVPGWFGKRLGGTSGGGGSRPGRRGGPR